MPYSLYFCPCSRTRLPGLPNCLGPPANPQKPDLMDTNDKPGPRRLFSRLGADRWAIALVVFVVLYVDFNLVVWRGPDRVINHDVVSYYGYLPATFIYGDLSLRYADQANASSPEVRIWGTWLDNGKVVIKTTSGMAVLYFPFFTIAHALSEPLGHAPNGYSLPYRMALVLATAFYLLLGLLALRAALRRFFGPGAVALALLTFALLTNMLHYATAEAPMPHVYGFFLLSLALELGFRFHEQPRWSTATALGLVVGLAFLVRPTNGLLVLALALMGVADWPSARARLWLWARQSPKLAAAVLVAFVVQWPQMLYWKMITGHFFFYSYGDEGFFLLQPRWVEFLFSFRKGWLLYNPVLLFALAGFVPLWRRRRALFLGPLLVVALSVYLFSSWWTWWFGGGLASRPMIDVFPLLAFPLAAGLEAIGRLRLRPRLALGVAYGLLGASGLFNVIKYHYGAIHWDSMTRAAFFDSFFRARPSARFYHLVEAPDYDAAKLGIQATLPADQLSFPPDSFLRVHCDAETLVDGRPVDLMGQVVFEAGHTATDEAASSGRFALRSDADSPRCLGFSMPVHPGLKLRVELMVQGEPWGRIVLAPAAGGQPLSGGQVVGHRDGFDRVAFELALDSSFRDSLHFHLLNDGGRVVLYDDLKVFAWD